MWLDVPGLIELHVVTGLDYAWREVDVMDIMVHGRISQEDSCEIVVIKFAHAIAGPLDTDMGSKYLKSRKIRAQTVVSFEWCLLCLVVY